MKNKSLSIMLAVALATTVAGCGAINSENNDAIPYEESQSAQSEENTTDSVAAENNPADDTTTEENPVIEPETADLTFADLAQRQFEFCSGAGGWSENFTIEKDGFFTGLYNDSDMGDSGEGYEDGTCYSSSYTGQFTNLTKINEYTYTMELEDISYEEIVGTEEIVDNVRYIYMGSYCLGTVDTLTIYLPGTPLSELPEGIEFWIDYANGYEEELTMITIVDEVHGYGIYSRDRLEPLEDAQMTFNTYKESYEYYNELLSEAGTTAEMVEYTATMYELSDDCLNYIWRLIRYNVEEDAYKEILTEQREWIAEKEVAAEEAAAEYEGGSFATVSYNNTLATMTIERCEELIGYLE